MSEMSGKEMFMKLQPVEKTGMKSFSSVALLTMTARRPMFSPLRCQLLRVETSSYAGTSPLWLTTRT